MIDRLLIFDLKGKTAHFRKFYTSSSSLSYTFPPRTTITGLIAGILGRERDTYYEEFGVNSCKIALSIRNPIRKIIQTVNYIRTKGEDGYSTTKGVIKNFIKRKISKYPTPIELVIPKNFTEKIVYRIYFWHQDEEVIERVSLKIKENSSIYPIYLGISEFLGEVEPIDEPFGESFKKSTQQHLKIASVCRTDYIEELLFDEADTQLQYISERMPLEFGKGRTIKSNGDFIHEKNQRIVKAKLKVPCMEIIYNDNEKRIKENIIFME